jgi:hypothetical protein
VLAILIATGTFEKLAWVLGAVVVMLLCGGLVAHFASPRSTGVERVNLPKEFDRSFRKPPDEGGLL